MTEGSFRRAATWFRFEPLSGFDRPTAKPHVSAGHTGAVETPLSKSFAMIAEAVVGSSLENGLHFLSDLPNRPQYLL
jgi:hypothetical protein